MYDQQHSGAILGFMFCRAAQTKHLTIISNTRASPERSNAGRARQGSMSQTLGELGLLPPCQCQVRSEPCQCNAAPFQLSRMKIINQPYQRHVA